MATISNRELNRIGDGPAATVYAARRGEARVALKVYPKRFDKRTMSAFGKEQARLATVRRVSSILAVDGVDELEGGEPALRMELCAESLASLVERRGPVAPENVLVLGRAMAVALAAAHEAGVVHGGVSPSNVLFRSSGEPVLGDFGVTLRQAVARDPLHAIEYLPPETLRTGTLNESTDLYGLGAVLHFALSGRCPHPGRLGEQPGARVLRILGEPVPAINAENVPVALTTLVARLLAVDPARRPDDAAQVADQLSAMLGARPAPDDSFDDFASPYQPHPFPPARPPTQPPPAPLPAAPPPPDEFDDFAPGYQPPPPAGVGPPQNGIFPPAPAPAPAPHAAPAQPPPPNPVPPPQPATYTIATPNPFAAPPPVNPRPPVDPGPPPNPAVAPPSPTTPADAAPAPTPTADIAPAPPAHVGMPFPPAVPPTPTPTLAAELAGPPAPSPPSAADPAGVPAPSPPSVVGPAGSSGSSPASVADPAGVPAPSPPSAAEPATPLVSSPGPVVESVGSSASSPGSVADPAEPPVPPPAVGAGPAGSSAPSPISGTESGNASSVEPAGPSALSSTAGADPVDPLATPATVSAGPLAPSPTSGAERGDPFASRRGLGVEPSATPSASSFSSLAASAPAYDFGTDDFGPDPTTPPPTPPRRVRYELLVGGPLVAVLLAVVLVLLLGSEPEGLPVGGQEPASGGAPVSEFSEVVVELAEPVDRIDRVELTWHSSRVMDFAVVIAEEGEQEPDIKLAGRKNSMTVEVDPDRQYCFQVQASNSERTYESEPRPLRGATCR